MALKSKFVISSCLADSGWLSAHALQTPAKTLLPLPLGEPTRSWPQGGGECGGEVHRALGVPMGRQGGPGARLLGSWAGSWAGFLMEPVELLSRTYVPLVPSESPLCGSFGLFPPSPMFPHPIPQDKAQAQETSLGPQLCCFGGGVMWGKSILPSLMHPTILFCSNCLLGQLCWKPGFPQRLSHPCWLSKSVFSAGFLTRAKREDGSQATIGSVARTKVHVPITSHTGGQNSSQVPWHMVRDLTAPKALLPVDGC